MMHTAWDQLMIEDAIQDVLGFAPPPQKTTKTMCGKRVKMASISRKATCPECAAELERRDREHRELAQFIVDTTPDTEDAYWIALEMLTNPNDQWEV